MHDLQLTVNVTKYVTISQYINQLQYLNSMQHKLCYCIHTWQLFPSLPLTTGIGLAFWSCPAVYFTSSITTQRTACDNRHYWSRALSTGPTWEKKAIYMTVNLIPTYMAPLNQYPGYATT